MRSAASSLVLGALAFVLMLGEAIHSARHERLLRQRGALEPHDVARAIQRVAGRPEERLVNLVTLRCMRQARYAARDLGHFALAFPSYTHFTSPIRRYADLLMHQQLSAFLKTGRPLYPASKLQAHLFELGRKATLVRRVEQESRRFFALRYLEQNPGEVLTGTILREVGKKALLELAPLALNELVQLKRRRPPGTQLRFEVIAADARADALQLKELPS